MATIVKNKADLATLITSTLSAGKAFERGMTDIAASACYHVQVSGAVEFLNNILNGMPNGSKTKTFIRFAEAFSGAKFDAGDKVFVLRNAKHKLRLHEKFEGSELFKEMMSKSWADYTPAKAEEKPYDGVKGVKGVISKLEKSATNAAMLAELKAVVAKYETATA